MLSWHGLSVTDSSVSDVDMSQAHLLTVMG